MAEICECGREIVEFNGQRWCSRTLERYRAIYGEPPNPTPQELKVPAGEGWTSCSPEQHNLGRFCHNLDSELEQTTPRAPVAKVFADADNNGRDARVLIPPQTCTECGWEVTCGSHADDCSQRVQKTPGSNQ